MEPYRIITTIEALAELRIDTIVCPPRTPSLARRKAWKDLFVGFDSTKEWDVRETWTILTMHCDHDAPEVWVLWDPEAKKSDAPAPTAWQTVIPGRKPLRKAHVNLGNAKSAISWRVDRRRGAEADMSILQLDPETGKFTSLYEIPQGTLASALPWK